MGNHAETRMRDLAKQAVTQLPQQRPLYLVCHAQAHSDRVAAALSEAGVGDVRVVAGGVDRWLVNSVPTDYTAAHGGQGRRGVEDGHAWRADRSQRDQRLNKTKNNKKSKQKRKKKQRSAESVRKVSSTPTTKSIGKRKGLILSCAFAPKLKLKKLNFNDVNLDLTLRPFDNSSTIFLKHVSTNLQVVISICISTIHFVFFFQLKKKKKKLFLFFSKQKKKQRFVTSLC
jgi:hypothetical protein